MFYYAQRKSVKNGTAQPTVYKTGTRPEMERQYHLFCASAATNTDGFEVDAVEWGTIEQGPVERKTWTNAPAETPAQ